MKEPVADVLLLGNKEVQIESLEIVKLMMSAGSLDELALYGA